MDVREMIEALNELEKERGISKETIISAIEEALNTSYGFKKENAREEENDELKEYEDNAELGKHIEIDRETGVIELVTNRLVVETVTNPDREVSLEEARQADPDFEIGEIEETRDVPGELGRIAAHKAKNILIQKMKEAERAMLLTQFQAKEKDIISGTIQKVEIRETPEGEERYVYIDLGRIEGIMKPQEQVPGEIYRPNDKIKVYVIEVKEKMGKSKEPTVYVSRSHPGLVKKLFETEVPEIADGIVEIKGIAREAGSRSKIAVFSNALEVEAVGSCVGPKGKRVEMIVDELKGERIDIIKWSPSPAELITSSLSPAKVVRTYIKEDDKTSLVIVPDSMLSLAIGKEGQNVRLAAKLTGWKIDIKSESQIKASIEEELFENGEETVYEGNEEDSSFSTGSDE